MCETGDTVGIKIPKGTPIAKCVAVIRKIEPSLSISDISSRINNDEYVLSYDYTDDSGVKKIIKCYEGLTKLGITPTLYELDDEECDIEMIKNLNDMYDEIDSEIDEDEE
ncbi:hypothetical protein [Butyrivibrio sp. AE2032]|uniref:hypothetical protein n=1 Tax=Butyrivibrio sp. AE2032 TaxID=1458463 RepID=UPI0005517B0C|nr:hypothetical protein [Butyrivibrio sp. AE2032]